MSRRRAVLAVAGVLAALPLAAAELTPAQQKDLLPRPAEMAPLAARSLLLAITAAGERLVAVGDRGVILLSADGTSWEQVASPVQAALTAVSFADAQRGWIVGHDAAILHTADGGRTWTLQHFAPEGASPLLAVLALDAQRAWAIGAYGLFLATADGGATWAPLDAPALLEDGRHLNAMIRLGNGEWLIAGETGLLGVSPDGAQWQRLELPYEGSLFGALPRGARGALVFGLRGNAYVTDDVRANRWTRIETGTVQSLFGGALLPDGTAALVGADHAVLFVGADGSVRHAGPNGGASSGGLSGVLAHGERLVVVGEHGVATLPAAR
jgi:photosystem II stability/assembly factor-like uncharacterized protein